MTILTDLNTALAETAGSVRDSLVHVRTYRGGGAGVIWDPRGIIVTNAHVARSGPVKVLLPGQQWTDGSVIAADPDIDLAVIRVPVGGLPAAAIGDSKALRPGDFVLAQGHPWGVPGVVTYGVVIGVDAHWPGLPAINGRREWLVVNMRLRPGNSGGPVLDSQGRVVGIAAIMAGPDVGMAVPSHVVDRFVRTYVPLAQADRREAVAS